MNPPILTCPKHGTERRRRPGAGTYYCLLCKREYHRDVTVKRRRARAEEEGRERERRGETPYVLALKAKLAAGL